MINYSVNILLQQLLQITQLGNKSESCNLYWTWVSFKNVLRLSKKNMSSAHVSSNLFPGEEEILENFFTSANNSVHT